MRASNHTRFMLTGARGYLTGSASTTMASGMNSTAVSQNDSPFAPPCVVCSQFGCVAFQLRETAPSAGPWCTMR